jgi:hypothetical protein
VLVGEVAAWRRLDRATLARAVFAVALPAALLTVPTVTGPKPLGLRYLLAPILLAMVAASPLMDVLLRRGAVGRSLIAAAVVVQGFFLWDATPDALAWTSPPFRPGYRITGDANLDWGQDFRDLRAWARGNRPWVAYYGAQAQGSIPRSPPLLGANPQEVRGSVAASARLLTSARDSPLAWLRAYCPVDDLGGTILLYRFADHPDPPSDPPNSPAAALPRRREPPSGLTSARTTPRREPLHVTRAAATPRAGRSPVAGCSR